MKKIFIVMAAMMVMTTTAVAQDAEVQKRDDRKMPDKTELIQNRTNETVKKYGLNDEQAAKLLELNTKFADKMGPQRGRRGPGERMKAAPDRQKKDSLQRPEKKEGFQRVNAGGMEEMKKNMEAYEAELKTILTNEQFEAYKADRQNRMQRGPRDRQRQQRN